ncbi:MAG: 3-oxoacyl-[acyl-carrier-protein] reductase [Candidatus Omnitrophica bacterium]|nr:3-oxoacyl-[acyl-carrier-protein] reductase [Candidatus Omnitrophota bacterium]
MLKNKVVIITGATGGIGRAILQKFSESGAVLVLWDVVNPENSVQGLKEKGIKSAGDIVDITKAEQIEKSAKKVLDEFGRIDILINNAGITKDNLIIKMKEDEWDNVLNINLKGAFLCTKIIGKTMWSQHSGKIINMASIIGQIGNLGQANYSSSKAGLIALTKSAAKEFARANIQVNAVAPGYIMTPMTEKLSQNVKNKMLEAIPLKKFGTPDDVAEVVLFFASEKSDYITGQVLRVDGGLVM